MRSILAALLVLVPATAFAGHRGGGSSGGGGGGALSHVSSGLGHVSTSSGSRSGGSSSSPTVVVVDERPAYVDNGGVVVVRERPNLPEEEPPSPPAKIEGYFGVQKVHDSDTSFTAELAFTDSWVRIGGQLTQFSEGQGADMPALKLTIPSFTIGMRVDGGHSTRTYVEAGVVGAKTSNDPNMDTSWVGGVGGLRFESKLAPHAAFVCTAQLMIFADNVHATAASAGVRVGPLQASLRVVDFNIGPALWGPEVGLRF